MPETLGGSGGLPRADCGHLASADRAAHEARLVTVTDVT